MAVHSAVHDQAGKPLQDAVVYALAIEPRWSPVAGKPKATMVVENRAFTPPVLPVRIGTRVSFLNRDGIRHQIYSISAARTLDVVANRLSSSAEVVFDKPGVVVLGLALHDLVIGHIYVLETPYFARTGADGQADLEGLPRGPYQVRVWHPDMKDTSAAIAQRVAEAPGSRVDVDFRVELRGSRPQE